MRRGFTLHHNGPPAKCLGRAHERCVLFWVGVRDYHMNVKGWSNIAYSWGVCPHGRLFEGGGWDGRQFANGGDEVGADDGPDRDWFTVLCFVGGGPGTGEPEEKPTASMISGVRSLIAAGRRAGHCGLLVKPHSDWRRKPCPGPTFHALARAWDGRPFLDLPPAPTPLPSTEEDMRIIDCPGKPSLVVFGDRSTETLNEDERAAYLSANVPAAEVTPAERELIAQVLRRP